VYKDAQNEDLNAEINIEYPLIDSSLYPEIFKLYKTEIQHKLIDMIMGEKKDYSISNPQIIADQYITDYKETLKDDMIHTSGWYATRVGYIIYNKKNILSIVLNGDGYEGGAHPYKFNHYIVFNTSISKKLLLADVLTNPNDKKLLQIGEKYFRQEMNIPGSTRLSEAGYFSMSDDHAGNFYFPENFALTDSLIKFYYNDYEIASYAQGPSSMSIPLREIKEFLKEGY
jgi:hypothetical protein